MKRQNILIFGASGFIGRNIKEYFKNQGHIVHTPTRSQIDLLDYESFSFWQSDLMACSEYDAVVHCAGIGGKRDKQDSIDVVYKNIVMAENAYRISQDLGKDCRFFHIGSGAEQNRDLNISNIIYPNDNPKDYYGLSKRAIQENFAGKRGCCNLRAFGVFGEHEETQRFIYSAIHSYRHKMPITIHKDRRMDFFYVEDIARIIEAIIEHYPIEKMHDVNLAYKKRTLWLSDIAEFINTLGDYRVPIVYENKTWLGLDYYGSAVMLETVKKNCPNLKLVGLEEGIRRCYEQKVQQTDALDKLTRLTEEYGGYDQEEEI